MRADSWQNPVRCLYSPPPQQMSYVNKVHQPAYTHTIQSTISLSPPPSYYSKSPSHPHPPKQHTDISSDSRSMYTHEHWKPFPCGWYPFGCDKIIHIHPGNGYYNFLLSCILCWGTEKRQWRWSCIQCPPRRHAHRRFEVHSVIRFRLTECTICMIEWGDWNGWMNDK